MVNRKSHRIPEALTEAGRARHAELRGRIDGIRREVEHDLPELLAAARQAKAAHDRALAPAREALRRLKTERLAQGIELSEMEARSGISASALAALEDSETPVCSLSVLNRYAEALGKRLTITFSDPA